VKSGYINLVDLDFEYKIWELRLTHFINEMSVVKNRNEEVKGEKSLAELTSKMLEQIEKHSEELELTLNRIKVQEQELHFYNKDFPITQKHQFYADHELIRGRVEEVSKKHIDFLTRLMRDLTIK